MLYVEEFNWVTKNILVILKIEHATHYLMDTPYYFMPLDYRCLRNIRVDSLQILNTAKSRYIEPWRKPWLIMTLLPIRNEDVINNQFLVDSLPIATNLSWFYQ